MRSMMLAAAFWVSLTLAPALAQNAPPADKHSSIDEFIIGMMGYTYNIRPSPSDERRIRALLELGRSAITNVSDVDYFNTNSALATDGAPFTIVEKLIDLSTSSAPDVRINATRILADIVENRSVCVVLNRLVERDIYPAIRFNLFQIVRSVAVRLKYSDVGEWMQRTIDENYSFQSIDPIGENVQRADKTAGLLRDISRIVASKKEGRLAGNLRQTEPAFHQGCMKLANSKIFAKPSN